MGSLSLKKKVSTSLATRTGGVYFIIFKGPAGVTFGDFFNPGIASAVNSNGTYNFYFDGTLNNPLTYYTDGIDWFNTAFQIITNNIIPLNTIILIQNDFVDYVINFGGNIENYFSGKTSIKKQNLTVSGYSIALVNGVYKLQNTLINGRNWYLHDSLLFNVRWNNSTSRWNLLSNQGVELSVATNSTNNPWEATWSNNVQVSSGSGGKINLN
jgi:hypothetical protein